MGGVYSPVVAVEGLYLTVPFYCGNEAFIVPLDV